MYHQPPAPTTPVMKKLITTLSAPTKAVRNQPAQIPPMPAPRK